MSQKISMRSLLARVVISTRYTICGADLVKDFTRRTTIAFSYIFKSLPDSFVRIGPSRNVEQTLICFCILHHSCSFAIHSQNDRPFRLLKLL